MNLSIRGRFAFVIANVFFVASVRAQSPAVAGVSPLKLDMLVVVAHSDDETAITPFLARIAIDQRRKIGVLFLGSGNGGYNNIGAERSAALGMLRRLETQRGLASFGIDHVWFIGERLDGGSSNPLVSLGSWGHGALLEKTVRVFRTTQPEIVLSWLPAQVIGENHGDHQAAGIISAEAFDLAGDPTAFPAQVASAGVSTDGVSTWRPRKLYFFSDAFSPDVLTTLGPHYSNFDISPTKQRSYLSLAAEQLAFYPTQFSQDFARLFGVKFEALAAARGTPGESELLLKLTQGNAPAWPEPFRVALAKSRVGGSRTNDVFDGIKSPLRNDDAPGPISTPILEIGGPWALTRQLSEQRHLEGIAAIPAQIAVSPRSRRVSVPLRFTNKSTHQVTVFLKLDVPVPPGWNEVPRSEAYTVGPGATIEPVSVLTSPAERTGPWVATYSAEIEGKEIASTSIKLQVTEWTMPQ
jgi:LmbE family N-acetylglucosaminyl deacetylase